jgi:hypothetical protein
MARKLKGWTRPRPVRIAFLIEDGQHAALALDGIFADCYGRWGGRFSLIVPCQNGRIPPNYWEWLKTFDPDVVYSYVPLSRADVLEVHERLAIAHYAYHEFHGDPRLDVFGFKPAYDFTPLSSLSVIFRLARYRPTSVEGARLKIIDSWHTERPSRFLTDNLGTYHISRASGMYPHDAKAAAGLLTIVSPEKQADRRFGVPRDLDAVPTEMDAVQLFARQQTSSLSVASSLFAPRLDIRAGRWSSAFNLMVGDSFADRVVFWNARLLIPAWLDTDLCCLRVTLEKLREAQFLAIVGELLNRRNQVNAGSGGPAQVAVRSVSLNSDQLNEACALLRSTKPWGAIMAEPGTGMDSCVPSADTLRTARESGRFYGGLIARRDWTRFTWSPPNAQPPTAAPDHLADAPVRQEFALGYWCTDLAFEYDGPGPRVGDHNQWMLSRRWRMAGAFDISFVENPPHVRPPPARRSRDGNLAIFVSTDRIVDVIKVPTGREAMRYALAIDGSQARLETEHQWVDPPNKVGWVEPSNEARYLTGVLGMTGGLQQAIRFLLHPFLRGTLAKLGGTPSLATDQVASTIVRIQKQWSSESAFDLRDENERQALGNLIVKAAQSLKNPMMAVSYDDLKTSWRDYREAFWAARPREREQGSKDVDWDKHEASSLDACLVELRDRQILFQGHRWTCQKCHHKNWVDLGALSARLSCTVCKKSTHAPVEIHWLFRPNEFLIESLRDHSVLSLVWVLSALCERSRRSFIFVEPTKFGFTRYSENPDAESDLLVIIDGQAVLCEVKSSWRSLRSSHIDELVALASRLRPDIAMLAVMEKGTAFAERLAVAQQQLLTEGIKFELLTADTYDPVDDPYLR